MTDLSQPRLPAQPRTVRADALAVEAAGLMEANVPPTLCPSHDATFDVFSPSQRSPCPSLLNMSALHDT